MGLHVLNQTTHANLHEEVPVIAALEVHAQSEWRTIRLEKDKQHMLQNARKAPLHLLLKRDTHGGKRPPTVRPSPEPIWQEHKCKVECLNLPDVVWTERVAWGGFVGVECQLVQERWR